MSLALPVLFHWSPLDRRDRIKRRGLRPSTPTLVETYEESMGPRQLCKSTGFDTVKAVCLGTTPSHAWSLCGGIWGKRGEVWDLWQVALDSDDETRLYSHDHDGHRVGEVRVLNWIPKARVWHVGTRVVGYHKWSHA